jgi:hypothetical protein
MSFRILSIADIVIGSIYSPLIRTRFPDVNLVISCGDLPYYYLEFVADALDQPVFFVRGNHAALVEYTASGERTSPLGAVDLHSRVVCHGGLLLAGVEGSLRYSGGPFQYSRGEMWQHVFRLVPGLLLNRAIHGRYLDLFISHAPPAGIHDQPDLPHHGVPAFRWLLQAFKPAYHLHGHIHVYRPDTPVRTRFGATWVINTFGFAVIEAEPAATRPKAPLRFLYRPSRKGRRHPS